MKTIVTCLFMLVAAGLTAPAAAQGYEGYQGYKPPTGPKMIQPIAKMPKVPEAPKMPAFPTQPRFKPFQGQHVDSPRSGIDPYPKPKKPAGGFSTYDGH